MPSGRKDIHKDGKATQFPHNDPTKGGRPVSIKNQLKDLLKSDGNITIPANQVVKINKDGSVLMKVPTQMQLAMKLSSWAMSKKGNDSLKAIQMIMEQVDGKPKQEINQTSNISVTEVSTENYTKEEKEALLKAARNREA